MLKIEKNGGKRFKTINFHPKKQMESLRELWHFMKERKAYWIAPMVMVLLIIGLIIMTAGSSAVAPFIYTLF